MDDRQRSIAKAAVWTFTICLLIGIAVWRFNSLKRIAGETLSVLAPIIIGLVLAYLLSPLMNWIESKISFFTDRRKPHPRIKRVIAVTLTMVTVVAAVIGLVAAIVPELISSIKNLLVSLPDYLTSITNWINRRVAGLKDTQPQVYSALMAVWDSAQNSVKDFANQFEPKLDSIISGGGDFLSLVTSSAVSIITWAKNILIGLILAIYLLYNKERYLAQARKLLYALLPEEKVHSFLRIGSHVSYTFMHFLSGKTVDSLIIGLLCFIGMTILNMPYAALISIIVGVTNIIPFFGPFIGAIPSGVLILLTEPKKVIPFAIFILILQQFDGNILGPKILGDSLGLPMFWILSAIVIGGGMFGFVGMVAFVPLFAAMYTLFSDFLAEKLDKKGLPSEIDSYLTNEIHYAGKSPGKSPGTAKPEQEDKTAPDEEKEDKTEPEAPDAPEAEEQPGEPQQEDEKTDENDS
ncbi:MAG: AI-2E family transporter [Oscillospiraceae bacterium]|nr:AI-2E family transporter [Oscillospiraceae bacterium]